MRGHDMNCSLLLLYWCSCMQSDHLECCASVGSSDIAYTGHLVCIHSIPTLFPWWNETWSCATHAAYAQLETSEVASSSISNTYHRKPRGTCNSLPIASRYNVHHSRKKVSSAKGKQLHSFYICSNLFSNLTENRKKKIAILCIGKHRVSADTFFSRWVFISFHLFLVTIDDTLHSLHPVTVNSLYIVTRWEIKLKLKEGWRGVGGEKN